MIDFEKYYINDECEVASEGLFSNITNRLKKKPKPDRTEFIKQHFPKEYNDYMSGKTDYICLDKTLGSKLATQLTKHLADKQKDISEWIETTKEAHGMLKARVKFNANPRAERSEDEKEVEYAFKFLDSSLNDYKFTKDAYICLDSFTEDLFDEYITLIQLGLFRVSIGDGSVYLSFPKFKPAKYE